MTAPTNRPLAVLRVDGSARTEGSVSRSLTDALVDRLEADGAAVTTRDLTEGVPFVDQAWIAANFTADDDRSAAQREALAVSDTLVTELKAADVIVIGVPIYNFGVPAALKAWIDLVARARVTFRYTENGPEGLLKGKTAVLLVASGGTAVGSDIDFATGYLKHVLGFLGITNIRIVAADRLMVEGDTRVAEARNRVPALAAELSATVGAAA